MKEIQLTQGKKTIVCDCHYDLVKGYKWHHHQGYASRTINKSANEPTSRIVFMHQLIGGVGYDHKDLDGLNNQCSNLRPATHSQNMANRKSKRVSSTGYRGVYMNTRAYRKTKKPYEVQIRFDKKIKSFGYFSDVKEAARVYNREIVRLFGEFAIINEVT